MKCLFDQSSWRDGFEQTTFRLPELIIWTSTPKPLATVNVMKLVEILNISIFNSNIIKENFIKKICGLIK